MIYACIHWKYLQRFTYMYIDISWFTALRIYMYLYLLRTDALMSPSLTGSSANGSSRAWNFTRRRHLRASKAEDVRKLSLQVVRKSWIWWDLCAFFCSRISLFYVFLLKNTVHWLLMNRIRHLLVWQISTYLQTLNTSQVEDFVHQPQYQRKEIQILSMEFDWNIDKDFVSENVFASKNGLRWTHQPFQSRRTRYAQTRS